jgi:DNA-binding transcriptional MerR regulator
MLIGRVSELTGASRKAIRHYESIGLIPEPQRKGTYRVYEQHDLLVINMIRRAQSLGFSLSEIKDIVLQKTPDGAFPIDLVCEAIDKKTVQLTSEAERLLTLKSNLDTLKIDLVKNFS